MKLLHKERSQERLTTELHTHQSESENMGAPNERSIVAPANGSCGANIPQGFSSADGKLVCTGCQFVSNTLAEANAHLKRCVHIRSSMSENSEETTTAEDSQAKANGDANSEADSDDEMPTLDVGNIRSLASIAQLRSNREPIVGLQVSGFNPNLPFDLDLNDPLFQQNQTSPKTASPNDSNPGEPLLAEEPQERRDQSGESTVSPDNLKSYVHSAPNGSGQTVPKERNTSGPTNCQDPKASDSVQPHENLLEKTMNNLNIGELGRKRGNDGDDVASSISKKRRLESPFPSSSNDQSKEQSDSANSSKVAIASLNSIDKPEDPDSSVLNENENEDNLACTNNEQHDQGLLKAFSEKWDASYQQLIKFKERYGHLDVFKGDSYEKLHKWVETQRFHLSSIKNNPKNALKYLLDRVEKLDAIGFQWILSSTPSCGESSWDSMYEQMIDFQARNGNLKVPKNEEHPKLFEWMCNQLHQLSPFLEDLKSATVIQQEHIRKLHSIGFPWSSVKDIVESAELEISSTEAKWDTMFDQLLQFKEKHGHLKVPKMHDQKLHKWVQNQRSTLKKFVDDRDAASVYQCERVEKLAVIGFWQKPLVHDESSGSQDGQGLVATTGNSVAGTTDATRINEKWDIMFDQLLQFKEKHGHVKVPKMFDQKLHYWVQNQRSILKKFVDDRDAASAYQCERIEKLERIGFWYKPLGHDESSGSQDGQGLVATTRNSAAGTTDATRINEKWDIMFDQLLQFKEKHGHVKVPKMFDHKLHYWVQNQRSILKKFVDNRDAASAYQCERIEKLEGIGFWQKPLVHDESSGSQVGQSSGTTSDNAAPPTSHLSLDSSSDAEKWDTMYDALVRFSNLHNHIHVSGDENEVLSMWIKEQKSTFSPEKRSFSSLSAEDQRKMAKLQEIDFWRVCPFFSHQNDMAEVRKIEGRMMVQLDHEITCAEGKVLLDHLESEVSVAEANWNNWRSDMNMSSCSRDEGWRLLNQLDDDITRAEGQFMLEQLESEIEFAEAKMNEGRNSCSPPRSSSRQNSCGLLEKTMENQSTGVLDEDDEDFTPVLRPLVQQKDTNLLCWEYGPHIKKRIPKYLFGSSFCERNDLVELRQMLGRAAPGRKFVVELDEWSDTCQMLSVHGPSTSLESCKEEVLKFVKRCCDIKTLGWLKQHGQEESVTVDPTNKLGVQAIHVHSENEKGVLLRKNTNATGGMRLLQDILEFGDAFLVSLDGHKVERPEDVSSHMRRCQTEKRKLSMIIKHFAKNGGIPRNVAVEGGSKDPNSFKNTTEEMSAETEIKKQNDDDIFQCYTHFEKKFKNAFRIEFNKESGIHLRAISSSAWTQHKKLFGLACDSKCLCVYSLQKILSCVVHDKMQKDKTWANPLKLKEGELPTGFASVFASRFLHRLEAAFPHEDPEKLLDRLCDMWKIHERCLSLGSRCGGSCECDNGWESVFKEGLSEAEAQQSMKKRALAPRKRNVFDNTTEASISKKSRHGSWNGSEDNLRNRVPYDVVFDCSFNLPYYFRNKDGCVVASLSPKAVREYDRRVQIGTEVISVSLKGERTLINRFEDLRKVFLKARQGKETLKITFVNLQKQTASRTTEREWSANLKWRGDFSDGWAGGAETVRNFPSRSRTPALHDRNNNGGRELPGSTPATNFNKSNNASNLRGVTLTMNSKTNSSNPSTTRDSSSRTSLRKDNNISNGRQQNTKLEILEGSLVLAPARAIVQQKNPRSIIKQRRLPTNMCVRFRVSNEERFFYKDKKPSDLWMEYTAETSLRRNSDSINANENPIHLRENAESLSERLSNMCRSDDSFLDVLDLLLFEAKKGRLEIDELEHVKEKLPKAQDRNARMKVTLLRIFITCLYYVREAHHLKSTQHYEIVALGVEDLVFQNYANSSTEFLSVTICVNRPSKNANQTEFKETSHEFNVQARCKFPPREKGVDFFCNRFTDPHRSLQFELLRNGDTVETKKKLAVIGDAHLYAADLELCLKKNEWSAPRRLEFNPKSLPLQSGSIMVKARRKELKTEYLKNKRKVLSDKIRKAAEWIPQFIHDLNEEEHARCSLSINTEFMPDRALLHAALFTEDLSLISWLVSKYSAKVTPSVNNLLMTLEGAVTTARHERFLLERKGGMKAIKDFLRKVYPFSTDPEQCSDHGVSCADEVAQDSYAPQPNPLQSQMPFPNTNSACGAASLNLEADWLIHDIKKKMICRYWEQGFCRSEDECNFIHVQRRWGDQLEEIWGDLDDHEKRVPPSYEFQKYLCTRTVEDCDGRQWHTAGFRSDSNSRCGKKVFLAEGGHGIQSSTGVVWYSSAKESEEALVRVIAVSIWAVKNSVPQPMLEQALSAPSRGKMTESLNPGKGCPPVDTKSNWAMPLRGRRATCCRDFNKVGSCPRKQSCSYSHVQNPVGKKLDADTDIERFKRKVSFNLEHFQVKEVTVGDKTWFTGVYVRGNEIYYPERGGGVCSTSGVWWYETSDEAREATHATFAIATHLRARGESF